MAEENPVPSTRVAVEVRPDTLRKLDFIADTFFANDGKRRNRTNALAFAVDIMYEVAKLVAGGYKKRLRLENKHSYMDIVIDK